MASITLKNVDDALMQSLRVRAARHGSSMEDELRAILEQAVAEPDEAPGDLASAIRARVEAVGGVALEAPLREPLRDPPDWGV